MQNTMEKNNVVYEVDWVKLVTFTFVIFGYLGLMIYTIAADHPAAPYLSGIWIGFAIRSFFFDGYKPPVRKVTDTTNIG